jgi:hypothetical protein
MSSYSSLLLFLPREMTTSWARHCPLHMVLYCKEDNDNTIITFFFLLLYCRCEEDDEPRLLSSPYDLLLRRRQLWHT